MARHMAWGLLLLVVGSLLLASNFGFIPPFNIWDLWPLLLIWPAAKFLLGESFIRVDGRQYRVRLGSAAGLGFQLVALWVLIGAGAELLHNLRLFPFDWGDLAGWTLPLFLVGIGLAIMLRPRHGAWRWSHRDALRDNIRDGFRSGTSAVAGDLSYGSRPWVFKSPMTIRLWAGDVDVDLTTAEFTAEDNYLAVKAWAGEVTMRVPDDMDVAVEARCSAGEITVFDERRDGLGCEVTVARQAGRLAAVVDGQPAAAPRRLFIGVEMTFGRMKIK